MIRLTISLLTLFLVSQTVFGEARTWTSKAGTTLEADLVTHRGGTVILKTTQGKEITLSLNALSEADQKFLAEMKSKPEPKPQLPDSKPSSKGKNKKGKSTGGSEPHPVITKAEDGAWYSPYVANLKEVFDRVIFIKAGETVDFEFDALPDDSDLDIAFIAKERGKIKNSLKPPDITVDASTPGYFAFKAVTLSDKTFETTFRDAGGANFPAQDGKVKVRLTNISSVDTSLLIAIEED